VRVVRFALSNAHVTRCLVHISIVVVQAHVFRAVERIPHMNRIRAFSLFALLALGLMNAALVAAHAEYESSVPAAGAKLESAPDKVTIVFSEELSTKGNSISVKDDKGAVVDLGDTTLVRSDPDRKTLVVSLKAGLANGTYTVIWKNNSSDGHSEEGDFSFVVGTASASTPATLPRTGSDANLPQVALLGAGLLIGVAGLLRRWASK
jgi:LPXTG-motif cell wall-anchored protein